MNLQELKEEEARLRDRLSENQRKQNEFRTAEFIEKHGAEVGDTVTWTYGNIEFKGVISKIDPRHGMYYYALLFNKDGELGKREVCIYRPKTITIIEKAINQ